MPQLNNSILLLLAFGGMTAGISSILMTTLSAPASVNMAHLPTITVESNNRTENITFRTFSCQGISPQTFIESGSNGDLRRILDIIPIRADKQRASISILLNRGWAKVQKYKSDVNKHTTLGYFSALLLIIMLGLYLFNITSGLLLASPSFAYSPGPALHDTKQSILDWRQLPHSYHAGIFFVHNITGTLLPNTWIPFMGAVLGRFVGLASIPLWGHLTVVSFATFVAGVTGQYLSAAHEPCRDLWDMRRALCGHLPSFLENNLEFYAFLLNDLNLNCGEPKIMSGNMFIMVGIHIGASLLQGLVAFHLFSRHVAELRKGGIVGTGYLIVIVGVILIGILLGIFYMGPDIALHEFNNRIAAGHPENMSELGGTVTIPWYFAIFHGLGPAVGSSTPGAIILVCLLFLFLSFGRHYPTSLYLGNYISFPGELIEFVRGYYTYRFSRTLNTAEASRIIGFLIGIGLMLMGAALLFHLGFVPSYLFKSTANTKPARLAIACICVGVFCIPKEQAK